MVLIDTSAIFALADQADPNYQNARILMESLVSSDQVILTHNYMILEAVALMQRRLGLQHALSFLKQASDFEVHWIDQDDHLAVVALMESRSRRGLSLVDCASFVVMRRHGVEQALAFDGDFEIEGFHLYRA